VGLPHKHQCTTAITMVGTKCFNSWAFPEIYTGNDSRIRCLSNGGQWEDKKGSELCHQGEFLRITNPRHTCTARVTVLGLCVCVSVCLQLFSPYRDHAGSSAIPTALAQQGLEKLCGDFA